MKVFEYERGYFINVDIGLIIVLTRLVSRSGTLARALAWLPLTANDVAHLGLSVAGSNAFLFSVVESELVLIERADGDLDHAPAIREYYRLIRDDGAQVLFYGFAHPLSVPLLVYLAFAL